MSYRVKLDNFEGPFDLLFHLIKKEKVDVNNISISRITKQYLDHIYKMKALDLEITSEFLVMAATLMKIKSGLLLPKINKVSDDIDSENDNQIEIDPKKELINRILQYKKYKEAANYIQIKEKENQNIHFRSFSLINTEPSINLSDISLENVVQVLAEINERKNNKERIEIIKAEKLSIKEKMKEIMKKLFKFKTLILNKKFFLENNTIEVVVNFLAVLELVKQKKIFLIQKENFGDITLNSHKIFRGKKNWV